MPEDPRITLGDCTAVLFPIVQGVIPGRGVAQFPGGVRVVTMRESGCTYFWQPALREMLNWGGKSRAVDVEPLPKPSIDAHGTMERLMVRNQPLTGNESLSAFPSTQKDEDPK